MVDRAAKPAEPAGVLPDVSDFCRLLLVRHPELHADHSQRAVGAGAARLSRRGRASVLDWVRLLEPLPIQRVVCAEQPQSAEAAAALARARQLEVEREPRLRDQDLGEWQGRSWAELAREQPARVKEFFDSFVDVVPPGGESLGQAVERLLSWWTDTAAAAAGTTLVVVAAGSVLSGFAAAMLGLRLSRCISLHLPHGGIGVLDIFANGARIAAWNVDALR